MKPLVQEGTWFLLPVQPGQYGVGLVVRAPRRGGVLLGYFFGPRRTVKPATEWLDARAPSQSVLIARFRDRALLAKEWPALHVMTDFDRRRWPIPLFHRFDGSITATPGASTICDWQVRYGDENLITPEAETPATPADHRLAEDVVHDPYSLVREVAVLLTSAIPSADDGIWR